MSGFSRVPLKSVKAVPPAPKASKSRKPHAGEVANQPICTECGATLPPRPEKQKGPGRSYCPDKPCKKIRNARRLTRGSAIIEWAQTWRRNRGSGSVAQASFSQLCQILDQFNAEDQAAGRPPADLAAARMIVEGTLYCDRQRTTPAGRARRAAEKAAIVPAPDLSALRAKVEDESTTDNERAILAAALEIMTANAA
jgi:hypothetical protein